jgi:AcrR family transcriptional regulator
MQASTPSRERVLNKAEQLFYARGYSGVSMRDIADSLAMRQASLYYHVPQGKEQLYVEVAMRNLRRHQDGISKAIASCENRRIDMQLEALTDWFMKNLPLRLLSMLETDVTALSNKSARYLTEQVHLALFAPVAGLFTEAQNRGEIRVIDPKQLAGFFLLLMDGISYNHASGAAHTTIDGSIRDALDIFLNGLREN